MYVRLAFAVASQLEPEILIVDEVLAVGDAAFQQKCLGKMNEVSKAGRTVLFVSHNMAAIKSLCTRAILLRAGRVEHDGPVDEVVNAHLASTSAMAKTGVIADNAARLTTDAARFRTVTMTDLNGNETRQLYYKQPFRVSCECDVMTDILDGHFEISISTTGGAHVLYATSIDGRARSDYLIRGRYTIEAVFDAILLPRQYTVDVGIHHQNGTTADFVQRTLDFTVLRVVESGSDHYPWLRTRGYVRPPTKWQVRRAPEVATSIMQG
jgi:lipopolysaccharide transport system ATP-binding protein